MVDKKKKVCNTPESLNNVFIKISVGLARTMLTMTNTYRILLIGTLDREKREPGTLGPLQKITMEDYLRDYEVFRNLIIDAIEENIEYDDQVAIKEIEDAQTLDLKDELVDMRQRMMDKKCDDPGCNSCAPTFSNNVLSMSKFKTRRQIEREFNIELPEDSNIVPGDDEVN